MGIVYKPENTKLDQKVAIKVLWSDARASEDGRARFYRETKAAANSLPMQNPICSLAARLRDSPKQYSKRLEPIRQKHWESLISLIFSVIANTRRTAAWTTKTAARTTPPTGISWNAPKSNDCRNGPSRFQNVSTTRRNMSISFYPGLI